MPCWTQNARFSKGSRWRRENTDAEWAVPALQIGKVDSRSDPQVAWEMHSSPATLQLCGDLWQP